MEHNGFNNVAAEYKDADISLMSSSIMEAVQESSTENTAI